MGKLLRTRSCQCGSGRAARDCCGRFKRIREPEAARAYLHRQALTARELLAPFTSSGLAGLRSELGLLPTSYPPVLIALHASAAPELDRLCEAAARRSDVDHFVTAMAYRVDTPLVRVALAKAVVAVRSVGDIDEHLAAAALLDLDQSRSELLIAAIITAVRAELFVNSAANA